VPADFLLHLSPCEPLNAEALLAGSVPCLQEDLGTWDPQYTRNLEEAAVVGLATFGPGLHMDDEESLLVEAHNPVSNGARLNLNPHGTGIPGVSSLSLALLHRPP